MQSFKAETEAQMKTTKIELNYQTKMSELYEKAIFEATYATTMRGKSLLHLVTSLDIVICTGLITDSLCFASDWMATYETFLEAKIPSKTIPVMALMVVSLVQGQVIIKTSR